MKNVRQVRRKQKDRKCFTCKQDPFVTISRSIHLLVLTTMRSFFHFRKTVVALATLAVASLAIGQESPQTSPQVEELEIIDEVDQPAITIRKPETTSEITEKRQGGIVEEIKVKSGPSTYYLYPNGPSGVPGSVDSSEVRPALWKVHEFDIGEAKQQEGKKETEEESFNAQPLPPPSMQ